VLASLSAGLAQQIDGLTDFLCNLFRSSLGKKYLMAGTGLFLFLFVFAHLLGNLQIFLGKEALNRYGHLLQTNPELIWPARLILLACVLAHIWAAARLTRENRQARPLRYERWEPTAASFASRTMMVSGIIVALFIVYHLLHFTAMVQAANLTGKDFNSRPEFFDSQGRHDIYRMMVVGFRRPAVSLFYVAGVGLLCLHLSHGASAMWQSLGWKKRSYTRLIEGFGKVVAVAIFVGYISIPIAILAGLIE
jgi:succinate dehydrogenase / fumarate reductase cytochrome b subunit